MRVDIPVSFEIRGVRKGRQRHAISRVFEFHPVEIEEWSDEDAPVTVTWNTDIGAYGIIDGVVESALGYSADDGTMFVRRHGDTWWRPLLVDHHGDVIHGVRTMHGFDFFRADALEESAKGSGVLTPFVGDHVFQAKDYRLLVRNSYDPKAMFDQVTGSTVDYERRVVEHKAAGYRLVNGVMYEQCMEPVIGLQMTDMWSETALGGGDDFKGAILFVVTDAVDVRSVDECFNIEDADKALSRAAQLNGKRMLSSDLAALNQRLAPKLVEHNFYGNDERWRIDAIRQARKLVDEIGRADRPSAMDNGTLRILCDLRDALAAADDEERFDIMEDVASKAGDYPVDHSFADVGGLLSKLGEILGERPVTSPVHQTAVGTR